MFSIQKLSAHMRLSIACLLICLIIGTDVYFVVKHLRSVQVQMNIAQMRRSVKRSLPWFTDHFNRETCLATVSSMLRNGTLARNDTIFYVNNYGIPMSTPEAPIVTIDGCSEMCGEGFGWYKDIGPRLSTWLIPVFLLLSNMEVSPLDKRRYLMLVHLVADPIDSLLGLLTKLEAWSRCYYLAIAACGPRDPDKVRKVATVLGGFEELTGFYDNPKDVYEQIKNRAKEQGIKGRKFDRLVTRAAQRLSDSRTDERLRTLFATFLYGYQLISAFVTSVGGGNTSPPGGRIGIAMFLTWIVPSILLSNAIGGFTSRRTCFDILEELILGATKESDAWLVLREVAPSLSQHRTVEKYLDTLAWSGGIYSYRPSKIVAFSSGSRDLSPRCLLLLAAMPIITSSIIASVIIWHTPPIGIGCRNILVFVMTGLVFLSAVCTHVTAKFLKGSRHWHIVLVKDGALAMPSILLLFLACSGLFNSCYCWSGVYSLKRSEARIPLNTSQDFTAYDKTIYPTLVGVCLGLQILAFVAMMWGGWKGWKLMRWSEKERQAVWSASRRSFREIELEVMADPPEFGAMTVGKRT